jgi:hypothetical protein
MDQKLTEKLMSELNTHVNIELLFFIRDAVCSPMAKPQGPTEHRG